MKEIITPYIFDIVTTLILLCILFLPVAKLIFKGKKILYIVKDSPKYKRKKLLYIFLWLVIELIYLRYYDFLSVDLLSIILLIYILLPTIISEGGIFSQYHFYPYNKITSVSISNETITVRIKTGEYSRVSRIIHCQSNDINNIQTIFNQKNIIIVKS